MSRDLDSRITERERAAAAEWLESDKSLHAMRDHPWHTVPLMAGGWGAKLDTQARRDNWNTSWTSMLADSKLYSGAGEKGPDQDLLQRHVWGRWGRADCLQHDSYTCSMFPGSTGWPTQRLNTTDHNYFGAVGRGLVLSHSALTSPLQAPSTSCRSVQPSAGGGVTNMTGSTAESSRQTETLRHHPAICQTYRPIISICETCETEGGKGKII